MKYGGQVSTRYGLCQWHRQGVGGAAGGNGGLRCINGGFTRFFDFVCKQPAPVHAACSQLVGVILVLWEYC